MRIEAHSCDGDCLLCKQGVRRIHKPGSTADEELSDLLLLADTGARLDRESDWTKPCFNCGTTDFLRELVVVGVWSRHVGDRGRRGTRIRRPMCAECAAKTETT